MFQGNWKASKSRYYKNTENVKKIVLKITLLK